jgi:hypothetical protein
MNRDNLDGSLVSHDLDRCAVEQKIQVLEAEGEPNGLKSDPCSLSAFIGG